MVNYPAMDAKQMIGKQFAMQTHLFNNVLEGIDNTQGLRRLSGQTNHLRWIAGHLVDARYRFAQLLGAAKDLYPHSEKFSDRNAPPPGTRALDVNIDYPPLEDSRAHWNKISPVFTAAVSNMTDDQANMEMPFSTPIGGKFLEALLGFIVHHEAYHIGQMSILRRDLGLPGMSYKMNL